jgi:hypothetical protein
MPHATRFWSLWLELLKPFAWARFTRIGYCQLVEWVTARALIAEYAADPARLEDLRGRITAFRLSCCFERLKRSGRFEDVLNWLEQHEQQDT